MEFIEVTAVSAVLWESPILDQLLTSPVDDEYTDEP